MAHTSFWIPLVPRKYGQRILPIFPIKRKISLSIFIKVLPLCQFHRKCYPLWETSPESLPLHDLYICSIVLPSSSWIPEEEKIWIYDYIHSHRFHSAWSFPSHNLTLSRCHSSPGIRARGTFPPFRLELSEGRGKFFFNCPLSYHSTVS